LEVSIFQTDLAITVSYDAAYVGQYDSRPVREMSELRWRFIQSALNLPRGSRILDVGYGNGVFLKNARDLGMDIFGIEVHSQDYGIPRVAFDTTLSFDLISFFDSLEHFATFDAIMNLSAKNVVVSIPNRPACLASTPNLWRHYKPGEHLHYFSSASLDHLMRNWGFDQKIAEGFPEDELRGKLVMADETVNNIYTAIYTRR